MAGVEHQPPLFFLTLFFIEFIGVTLVNKFVSCAQFHNTSFVNCIVCSPPKVIFIPLYSLPPLPSPFSLVITILLSVSMNSAACFNAKYFSDLPPISPDPLHSSYPFNTCKHLSVPPWFMGHYLWKLKFVFWNCTCVVINQL